MRRILFICSRNKQRSPTAEEIFRNHPGVEVDSAGLAPDAEVTLSTEQIEWTDLIIAMESIHKQRLNRRYKNEVAGKRVVVLGIPDKYPYMDEVLIAILRLKCARFLL